MHHDLEMNDVAVSVLRALYVKCVILRVTEIAQWQQLGETVRRIGTS